MELGNLGIGYNLWGIAMFWRLKMVELCLVVE